MKNIIDHRLIGSVYFREESMVLSGEELGILLGGARVELKIRRNEVSERRVM